jgi:hypothetical protein
MPTTTPTKASSNSSRPARTTLSLPNPAMTNPVAPASPLAAATAAGHRSCWRSIGSARQRRTKGARAQATEPTSTAVVTTMPGSRPAPWTTRSSKAAIPAGLAILTTPTSITVGCSIVQPVIPAKARPNSQGTRRQRRDGSRPSGNNSNNSARPSRFNGQVQ